MSSITAQKTYKKVNKSALSFRSSSQPVFFKTKPLHLLIIKKRISRNNETQIKNVHIHPHTVNLCNGIYHCIIRHIGKYAHCSFFVPQLAIITQSHSCRYHFLKPHALLSFSKITLLKQNHKFTDVQLLRIYALPIRFYLPLSKKNNVSLLCYLLL